MACVDVPIPDQQESECQPDVSFFEASYGRIFPVDPPEESEHGIKALVITYDVAGNEKMRGEFWVKQDEKRHWFLTPILPAFPV